jgi:hypothetical protein
MTWIKSSIPRIVANWRHGEPLSWFQQNLSVGEKADNKKADREKRRTTKRRTEKKGGHEYPKKYTRKNGTTRKRL